MCVSNTKRKLKVNPCMQRHKQTNVQIGYFFQTPWYVEIGTWDTYVQQCFQRSHLDLISLTLSPRGCRLFHARGGGIWSPLGNQERSGFRPPVAKYKLDLFRNWAHMQKIGQKLKKLSEISRFQNFEKLRFYLTLTHGNCNNSLKFWDSELIFW